jgi:hypothetical protein
LGALEAIASPSRRFSRLVRKFEVCHGYLTPNWKLRCSHYGIVGRPFTVDKVKLEDLEAGNLKASWTLGKRHPSFTEEQAEQLAAMLKTVLIGTLVSCAKGSWDVSSAFNQLLPEYEFTQIEEFLAKVWEGKP